MHWIDWLVMLCPLLIVAYVGIKTQKYVKGVSDFLSAGRVAGRYVVCVAGAEAGMGLIAVVGYLEMYYQSGLAYSFWNHIGIPLQIVLSLTGYCAYRYRETRSMTMGQFLEIRYSRSFRILAGFLQSISGILNYSIFPAVSARFLVYFCDLPVITDFGAFTIPTFMIIMAIFLLVAVFVSTVGGQITIMSTDCIQGILGFPIYAIVALYLLMKFPWFSDIVPPLLTGRPEGQNFLNPLEMTKLRDFNMFYVFVGLFSSVVNRMGWSGNQGYNSAARNAHEQKMGGVLGNWRGGFFFMMLLLLAVSGYAFLNGDKYTNDATDVRSKLAAKVMADVTERSGEDCGTVTKDFDNFLETGKKSANLKRYIRLADKQTEDREEQIRQSKIKWGLLKEKDKPKEEKIDKNQERLEKLEQSVGLGAKVLQGYNIAEDKKIPSQTYTTIFGQMRVPMALRRMLPIGITGLFCAMCVFLLISTDTTQLHSWSSIIVQDVILPIRGKPFTPRQHLRLLRLFIVFVAFFAFCFSAFFNQVDFIFMFFAITGAIWLGGAGPCIVLGLYWKRGTSAGAFTALIVGSTLSVLCIFIQKIWESAIYPWLDTKAMVGNVAVWLQTASSPFEPYIKWRMAPDKFPINSQELFFMVMLLTISLYIIVSLLTCKKPFNMERMLHRGKYQREGEKIIEEKYTLFGFLRTKLIGIDSQFTFWDKVISYSVFIYHFVWFFLITFIGILLWNWISPWPLEWWANFYFLQKIVLGGLIYGAVSTVWFGYGGTRDLIRMFKDLAAREANILDDGRVIDGISADDVAMVEQIDHINIEEAHIEEEILKEELKEEKEKREEDDD